MKAIYVVLKSKEKWPCAFCPDLIIGRNEGVYEISTRNLETNRPIARDFACEECHQKYRDGLIPKCGDCDKLLRRADNGECFYCNTYRPKYKEDLENNPREIDDTIRLEKQLYELSLKEKVLEEELDLERTVQDEAWKVSERWNKEQKQELLDKIKKLETQLLGVEETNKKARRLSDENRILRGEIEALSTEVEKYKGENSELKSGISQIKSDVLETEAKIEKLLSGTELQAQIEIFKN